MKRGTELRKSDTAKPAPAPQKTRDERKGRKNLWSKTKEITEVNNVWKGAVLALVLRGEFECVLRSEATKVL